MDQQERQLSNKSQSLHQNVLEKQTSASDQTKKASRTVSNSSKRLTTRSNLFIMHLK